MRRHVAEDDGAGAPVDQEGDDDADCAEDGSPGERRFRRQEAGGDRPAALGGMQAVALAVADVVDQVVGAGDDAEGQRGDHAAQQQVVPAGRRRPGTSPG